MGVGDGSFREFKQFYTGVASFPVSVSVDDIGKAGIVDLVVVNRGSACINIFHGAENSTFEIFAIRSDHMVDPGAIVIADFNNDHQKDILVANMVGNKNFSLSRR